MTASKPSPFVWPAALVLATVLGVVSAAVVYKPCSVTTEPSKPDAADETGEPVADSTG